MMVIRTLGAFGLVVGCAAMVFAGPPETAPQIPNYRRIAPGVAAAGLPSPESLAQLKDMGFRTVIDLRTEQEGTAAERAAVEAQGLRYVNVPVSGASFGMGEAAAVQKALEDPAAGPVLLHCASSNRVGAIWALIQSRKGQSPEQALAAGRVAGLQSPALVEAVSRQLGLTGAPGDAAGPQAAPPMKP